MSSRSPSPSPDGGPDLFYQRLDNSKWTMLDIRCTTWKLLDKKHMWWSSVWPVWQSVWPVWSVWSVWISETSVTSDTSSVFSGRQRSQIRENWQGWEGLWGELFICSIHIRYQKWDFSFFPGSSLKKFLYLIHFRLPEKAMVEIKPSAVNRSTNSDILIYNRVDQLKILEFRILFQQVHCRYQNVAQVPWKGCWEPSVDGTTSRFTFHKTPGGISSAFDPFSPPMKPTWQT